MVIMAAISVGYTAEAKHGAFLNHDRLAALARTTSHRLDALFTTKFHSSGNQALEFVHALQAYSLKILILDRLSFGERSLPLPLLFHAIFILLSVFF